MRMNQSFRSRSSSDDPFMRRCVHPDPRFTGCFIQRKAITGLAGVFLYCLGGSVSGGSAARGVAYGDRTRHPLKNIAVEIRYCCDRGLDEETSRINVFNLLRDGY